MRILYILYQLFVAVPILLLCTLLTALSTILGCTFSRADFWGYWPARWWGKAMCRLMLLPVRVEGYQHLDPHTSYIFCANHQGAYDIFLILGYLPHSFRWMMKHSLRHMFLIGPACEAAGHIMVDRRNAATVRRTITQAHQVLQGGISLVLFPEGARTFCGTMANFRRGGFLLADELQLPLVPVTIDGSYDVLPRHRRIPFLTWHPLRLVIHPPILPIGRGEDNIAHLMTASRQVINSALPPHYQGFQPNPDQ